MNAGDLIKLTIDKKTLCCSTIISKGTNLEVLERLGPRKVIVKEIESKHCHKISMRQNSSYAEAIK